MHPCSENAHRPLNSSTNRPGEQAFQPAGSGDFPVARCGHLWRLLFIALASTLVHAGSARAHWPQFRGPNGSAIGRTDFPVHFSPTSNVVWKTALPPGNSSPCIWGDRVFLTGFTDGQLETLCLDRRDGRILWRHQVQPGKIERGAKLGSPATATPVTDGLRVYVYFGSFGLLCYDLDGAEQWRKPLPIPITQHGAGTSPILAGYRLLLACDQDIASSLLAVQKHTGKTLWQADRAEFRRGYSTPLLWPAQQPQIAIVAGTLRVVAYDLANGTERWSVRGLPNEMVASPVAGDGLIFVAGWTPGAGSSSLPPFEALLEQGDKNGDGKLTREESPTGPARQHFLYIDADKDGIVTRAEWESIAGIFGRSQNALLAIRPGGQGDATDSHLAWKQSRGLPYCPSPLYYNGRIYLVKNGGLASCFDAKTGAVSYQEERLGALGDYYSSPVAAAGKVCVISQPGVAVIYRAGDTLEVLARNALGEPVVATPAIVQGELYVRTQKHLYAFGYPARVAFRITEEPAGE